MVKKQGPQKDEWQVVYGWKPCNGHEIIMQSPKWSLELCEKFADFHSKYRTNLGETFVHIIKPTNNIEKQTRFYQPAWDDYE
jgi:hypothetical protein